jgi:hypothetical protein
MRTLMFIYTAYIHILSNFATARESLRVFPIQKNPNFGGGKKFEIIVEFEQS